MNQIMGSNKSWAVLSTIAAVFIALGWAAREQSFATQKAELLKSQTVTRIKLDDHTYEGRPRGVAGLYFQGQTHGTRMFMVGQFQLKPGEEPHPVHSHEDEEILIVASGTGEIECDGSKSKVGPGSVMYTGPNAPHGIKNTGDDVLTFYFIKWIGVSR